MISWYYSLGRFWKTLKFTYVKHGKHHLLEDNACRELGPLYNTDMNTRIRSRFECLNALIKKFICQERERDRRREQVSYSLILIMIEVLTSKHIGESNLFSRGNVNIIT